MSSRIVLAVLAMVGGLAILGALGASAQPAPPPGQSEVSWHHQMLYCIMKDMTQEMAKMADEMSRGDLTAEQRRQMGQRMEPMATLMRRMSGLAARPAMADPESQKQMEKMRKEMDAMMRDPRMAPATK